MEYLTKFKRDLYFAGMRERTVESYYGHLQNALRQINKPIGEIEADDIYTFLLELYEKGFSGSSVKSHFFALRHFFENTLEAEWKLSRIPKLGYFDRNQPRPLTREEVKKILSGTPDEIYRMIFALMYSSGLRISEVCMLKKNVIIILVFL